MAHTLLWAHQEPYEHTRALITRFDPMWLHARRSGSIWAHVRPTWTQNAKSTTHTHTFMCLLAHHMQIRARKDKANTNTHIHKQLSISRVRTSCWIQSFAHSRICGRYQHQRVHAEDARNTNNDNCLTNRYKAHMHRP